MQFEPNKVYQIATGEILSSDMKIKNRQRLEWAIRNKQPWPLIQKIEGVTYEEYRRVKWRIRAEKKAKDDTRHSSKNEG